jgi:tetratricopeptide (TPR) repeat protein
MHAVLEGVVGELSQDAQRVFRVLGALPIGRFAPAAAAAAAGLPVSDTIGLLAELAEAQLLYKTAQEGYRLYPAAAWLSRELAADAPRSERGDAVERLSLWYLGSAVNAAGAVRPYRRDVPERPDGLQVSARQFTDMAGALEWLDAEAEQIYVLAQQLSEGRSVTRAIYLLGQLWALWAYRKRYRLWESCDTLALHYAQVRCDKDAQARVLRRLGLLCTQLGRYTEADAYLSDAAALFEDLGEEHRSAGALGSRGVMFLRKGSVELARAQLNQALTLHRRLGDTRQVGLVLIDLANAEIERGSPSTALSLLHEAELALGDSLDLYSLARLRMITGRAHGLTGDSEQAARELSEAHEAMVACDAEAGAAEVLIWMAELEHTTGQIDAMQQRLLQATERLDYLDVPETSWLRQRVSVLTSGTE